MENFLVIVDSASNLRNVSKLNGKASKQLYLTVPHFYIN